MNEKEKLMKRIQMCDFVLIETALYLDAHPDNKEAIEYYNKHLKMKQAAMAEYQEKFGVLTQNTEIRGNRWEWVDGGWPWQLQENEGEVRK